MALVSSCPSPPAKCTSPRQRTRFSKEQASSSATSCPAKVEHHPLSTPVPYYHSNVDSDEVMFYCGGDEARKGSGIEQGSITLHPGGHTHGPHPGVYEHSIGAESFNELAVMIDTFSPLRLGAGGNAADDGVYAWSWSANAAASSQRESEASCNLAVPLGAAQSPDPATQQAQQLVQ